MMYKTLSLSLLVLIALSGCEKKEEKSTVPGMKCGAGKCGANMFNGNSALAKKKTNVLSQMRENDTRKACVLKAKTTKSVYNCVRDEEGKLSLKCGVKQEAPAMKCGAGKCGSSM